MGDLSGIQNEDLMAELAIDPDVLERELAESSWVIRWMRLPQTIRKVMLSRRSAPVMKALSGSGRGTISAFRG